jgi:hypothetical protein
MSSVILTPIDGKFEYLLREPRHERRRRRIWITACIVVFVALAPLAWAISALAPHHSA